MSKKAPDERPKRSTEPVVKTKPVAADLGSDINSNLGPANDEDKESHVLRTKTHPYHDEIEKNNGMIHKVDSRLYKSYNDTIRSRIAKYKVGDNIHKPIHGPERIFQGYSGNELESHFSGPDMEKKHANPDYNKTIYYGRKRHSENSPGSFEGVYKTEEHIPKETVKVAPKKKIVIPKRRPQENWGVNGH